MNNIYINTRKVGSGILLLSLVLLALLSYGCATSSARTNCMKPGAAASGSWVNLKTDLYCFCKRVPSKTEVGETITYEYTLIPEVKLGSVVVRDRVPAGGVFISTSPEAIVNNDLVTWNLGTLPAGEKQLLTLEVKANESGVLKNCASVSAIPLLCTATTVGKPSIVITKTGPATARLGQKVDFTIEVRNDGSSAVRDVVVTDPVPSGLAFPDGKSIHAYEIGTLDPGKSRTITVPLVAAERGRHTNLASVNTSNAGSLNAEAVITVLAPAIRIAKTGPESQFVNKTASYVINVENTGDIRLDNINLTDRVSSPMKLISASGARINGNTATWKIGSLERGQNLAYEVQTTSSEAGEFANQVTVLVPSEDLSASDRVNTVWRGFAALLIEVADTRDPLIKGEETSYRIRVTNQGSAPDGSLVIVAHFPEEIDPVDASGSTPGKIDGKTVTFAPVATLPGGKWVDYIITARGVREGDARVKVFLTSDLLKSPVIEEESTHVY